MQWNEVIGHEETIRGLQVLLKAGRVPHAMLFSGPEGVGKSVVANILAAGLLCAANEERPCGCCSSCRQIATGNHPDLTVIRPDGTQIKIDQVRQLQSQAALAPYHGNRRVAILDNAEKMNIQAMNSLLKFLEDPPEAVVIILVAANKQMLLETILSRCRAVEFKALSFQTLVDALISRVISLEQAECAARLSGGRLGAALSLLEPGGLLMRDKAMEIMSKLIDAKMSIVWEVAAELDKAERQETLEILRYCGYILRDMTMTRTMGADAVLLNVDLADILIQQAERWSEKSLLAAYSAVNEARRAIQSNANVRLTSEALFISLLDYIQEDWHSANSCRNPV